MLDHLRTPKWKLRPEVLLHPNIPKPMHGMAPRLILGEAWWEATRKAAYASTAFHCIACGVWKYEAKEHKWLEGHELYDIDYPMGRMTYVETVPLCHWCHNFIHDGRLKALLDKGKCSLEKYEAVMKHGQAVLRAAKLKAPKPFTGQCAEWGDWRLVLNGEEHPPVFKTFDEWKRAYAK